MEGIPEQDMIDHELKIQANNHNNNKKAKSSGSGQYGELSLEQLQQQLAAHKAASTTSPTTAISTGPSVNYPPQQSVVQPPQPLPQPPTQPQAGGGGAGGYYGFGQPVGYGAYPPFNNQHYTPPPPLNAYPPQNFGPPTG